MIERPPPELLVSNRIFLRAAADPPSRALRASGPEVAFARAFRLLEERCEMGAPLAGSGFEAWKLPKRKNSALEHDWAVRACLGPLAKVLLPPTPPPAPKKVPSWGGSSAPRSTWAVWLPSARVIRRIPLVRRRHCEAGKAFLVRSEGRTSRARGEGETDVPQQAKVGYCPCCTAPTHVMGLPSREAGVFEPLEARGVALSAQFGPWEGRRFAAFRCSEFFGRLTKEWDWAASRVALATNPASLPARRDPVTTNERKKGKKRCPHMRVRGKAPHSRDGIHIRFLPLARNFLRATFPPSAWWFLHAPLLFRFPFFGVLVPTCIFASH